MCNNTIRVVFFTKDMITSLTKLVQKLNSVYSSNICKFGYTQYEMFKFIIVYAQTVIDFVVEPLVEIQNNFTEMILIKPSNWIAQIVSLHRTKGSPEL